MAAPNIVNVTTITGVTTFHAGIAVTTGGKGAQGVTTVVSNAAASGKVLKINSLTASGIGKTTGVTLNYYNHVNSCICWINSISWYDNISTTLLHISNN